MCLSREIVAKLKSPRKRHLREPVKPRLSRKIVASARVNLNRYWHKFEEVAKRRNFDNEINENLANEIRELGN